MPELPDVETFKRYFDATSLHQRIADVDVILHRLQFHRVGFTQFIDDVVISCQGFFSSFRRNRPKRAQRSFHEEGFESVV